MLNLKSYGAAGDGVTDDTQAILAWQSAMLGTGEEGYAPTGRYICTQRLLFGMPPNMGKAFTIHGDGPYKTIFDVHRAPASQGPQVHFYTAGGVTSSYPIVSNVGFSGDTPNTLLAIGLEDFSDNVGNANFTNVFVGNDNSGRSSTAISMQLNYVFDSSFTNCVVVGNPNVGNALDLRSAVFCNFQGGSFSNAGRGIRIRQTSDRQHSSICNKFTVVDIENVNYGIVCENTYAQCNVFDVLYFDIWDPNANVVPTGWPVYSSACGSGGLIIEHPHVDRGPSALVQPGNTVNVFVTSP